MVESDCRTLDLKKHPYGGDCDDMVYVCCAEKNCGKLSKGWYYTIVVGATLIGFGFFIMGARLCAEADSKVEGCANLIYFILYPLVILGAVLVVAWQALKAGGESLYRWVCCYKARDAL